MKTLLIIFLWQLSQQALIAQSQQITPPSLTQVATTNAKFSATIENETFPAIYHWLVNNTVVATINVTGTTAPSASLSHGHGVFAIVRNNKTFITNLTIFDLSIGSALIQISRNDTGILANATLTVRADCGEPPTGLNISSCRTHMCTVNSSTLPGRSGQSSPFLYSCYNTSTCGKDAQWTTAQRNCITSSPVDCAQSGMWGPNCTMSCSMGCVDPTACDFRNGSCVCLPGFIGATCNQTCPDGMWGQNCADSCGAGCPDTICHGTNGSCLSATTPGSILTQCLPGYKGALCNENCTTGTWGSNCGMTCGAGCPDKICDRANGSCLSASTGMITAQCLDDYKTPLCTEKSTCQQPSTWGPDCTYVCGFGCPNKTVSNCNMKTGKCVTDPADCMEGYTGLDCATPICDPADCNGGVCMAPNLCQLCPTHFASGPTCRNIRLDGFLKGSLSTFAILTVVIIFLSVASKWYVRKKVQIKND